LIHAHLDRFRGLSLRGQDGSLGDGIADAEDGALRALFQTDLALGALGLTDDGYALLQPDGARWARLYTLTAARTQEFIDGDHCWLTSPLHTRVNADL
jgi:hypothetical protein